MLNIVTTMVLNIMMTDLGKILDELRDSWHWFKWDLELWWGRLPIAGWAFKEFLKTGDLGYLHDAIISLLP